MDKIKKNRETLSAMIVRARNRFMSLSAETEKGRDLHNDEGKLKGIAFADSEMAIKWMTAARDMIVVDSELAKLEAMMKEHNSGVIRRPAGNVPIQ